MSTSSKVGEYKTNQQEKNKAQQERKTQRLKDKEQAKKDKAIKKQHENKIKLVEKAKANKLVKPKTVKPKKKKPVKITSLKLKLDFIFSLYIRLRDKRCVVCNSRANLQNGHRLSRVANATRRDERNCNTQCSTCNVSHEYDTRPYTNRMIRTYGRQVCDELSTARHTTAQLKPRRYEEQINKYQGLVDDLLRSTPNYELLNILTEKQFDLHKKRLSL